MRWTLPSVPKLVSFAAWFCVLAGVAVFGLQVFGWLDSGQWTSYPLLDSLGRINQGLASWTAYPREWVGLHTALSWVSLSVGLAFVGALLGFLSMALDD